MSSLHNISLITASTSASKKNLLVKQSYLLFTWMSYIQDFKPSVRKSTHPKEQLESQRKPCFFVQKKCTSKRTYLKAPMAHKTFSQEQFLYQTYKISVSFTATTGAGVSLNSINDSLYVALKLRHAFAPAETNLFFLKKMTLTYCASDAIFMSLR